MTNIFHENEKFKLHQQLTKTELKTMEYFYKLFTIKNNKILFWYRVNKGLFRIE